MLSMEEIDEKLAAAAKQGMRALDEVWKREVVMPRVKRFNPPSVYVVEAIVQAVAENSMDVMTATKVMFSLFNTVPLDGDEEDENAKASHRRVKAKANRNSADQLPGIGDLPGDKF
jgi:hypothetical protein